MLATLKHTVLSILGRIPLVKKLVPEKYHKQNINTLQIERPELEDFHRQKLPHRPELSTITLTPTQHQIQSWQQEGKEHIRDEIENFKPQITHKLSDLTQSIDEHIGRLSANPNSEINFNEELITNSAINALNIPIEAFQRKLDEIQHQTQNKISTEPYIKLINKYINDSFRFILELNNYVLKTTINLDNNVSDYDLARAFNINRKISQSICHKALKGLEESFDLLPAVAIETNTGPISITEYIKLELANSIKALYLGSKFGIHSSSLVNSFKDQIQKINYQDEVTTHLSCRNLNEFKSAIHGSLLQDPINIQPGKLIIAELDANLLNQSFQRLIKTITDEFRLENEEQKTEEQLKQFESLKTIKLEIAKLLTHNADVELETKGIVESINSDPAWKALNLGSEESTHNIIEKYSSLYDTTQELGTMNDEVILGRNYQGQKIIDTLRFDEIEATTMREHFERLLYEVSLIALLDALDTFRANKTKDTMFDSHPNFKTIPWLKHFYQQRRDEYASWIESRDITPLPIRRLAKKLAQIGKKLHNISTSSNSLFEFDDLCSKQRYNVIDPANALLKRAGSLTDVGVMSLHLELFSNLFAYLRPGQDHGLNDKEVKQITEIIEFLRTESMLLDENGKQVIAPKADKDGRNEIGTKKKNHLLNIIGSQGTLLYKAPIIIKFLMQSLKNDHKKPELGDGQSIEHRNSILASLLFYILIKYLPEQSSDIYSLRSRALIFKALMNLCAKDKKYVPIFYNKMLKQALGTGDNLTTAHMDNKEGVFLAFRNDLQKKIKEYPKQLAAYHTALKSEDPEIKRNAISLRPNIQLKDLLEVYMDIETFAKQMPATLQEIERRLDIAKGIKAPLFMGIEEVIKTTLESETATVVNFVKERNNENLTMFTHKLLIEKSAKLASMILKNNIDDNGNLLIFDSHQNTINALIDLLIYSKQAAYLINKYGANKIQIRDIKTEPQYNENIRTLSQLLKRRIVLITNLQNKEIEEFPGQAIAKKILVELLKEPEFEFKPIINNRFDWNDINTIREKLKAAKEAEYSFVK